MRKCVIASLAPIGRKVGISLYKYNPKRKAAPTSLIIIYIYIYINIWFGGVGKVNGGRRE